MLSRPFPNTKPICPFFHECGGCDSQDIRYADQIAYKEAWLKELFALLLTPTTEWRPFLASPDPYPVFFRNKIRFSFIEVDGKVWPSRHQKGEAAADIPVDTCFLHSPESVEIINFTAAFAQQHGWTLYNPHKGTGWLKHLLIRQSKHSGDIMLSLVTDDAPIPGKQAWIDEVTRQFSQVKSLFHTVSWGKSNEQLTDSHLWGDKTITEQVGEQRYIISPQAFFQTNGAMVETLYNAVRDTAALTGTETVWDLYAGSATIGLYLSKQAQRVISIENNPANITDAAANIALNNAENVSMVAGRVETVLTSAFMKENGTPNLVIVDPPRAGLHDSLRRILPFIGSHRLLYVSCNPLSCVRDIKDLTSRGYTLKSIRGIDMFPHTWHCEVLAELAI